MEQEQIDRLETKLDRFIKAFYGYMEAQKIMVEFFQQLERQLHIIHERQSHVEDRQKELLAIARHTEKLCEPDPAELNQGAVSE